MKVMTLLPAALLLMFAACKKEAAIEKNELSSRAVTAAGTALSGGIPLPSTYNSNEYRIKMVKVSTPGGTVFQVKERIYSLAYDANGKLSRLTDSLYMRIQPVNQPVQIRSYEMGWIDFTYAAQSIKTNSYNWTIVNADTSYPLRHTGTGDFVFDSNDRLVTRTINNLAAGVTTTTTFGYDPTSFYYVNTRTANNATQTYHASTGDFLSCKSGNTLLTRATYDLNKTGQPGSPECITDLIYTGVPVFRSLHLITETLGGTMTTPDWRRKYTYEYDNRGRITKYVQLKMDEGSAAYREESTALITYMIP